MKPSEIKDLLIKSAGAGFETRSLPEILEESGVSFDFKDGFEEKVLNRISSSSVNSVIEPDFTLRMNSVFYRIALTGVAAIVLLLISIYISEGSVSLNSFLGMSDNYDESIVCILTGN